YGYFVACRPCRRGDVINRRCGRYRGRIFYFRFRLRYSFVKVNRKIALRGKYPSGGIFKADIPFYIDLGIIVCYSDGTRYGVISITAAGIRYINLYGSGARSIKLQVRIAGKGGSPELGGYCSRTRTDIGDKKSHSAAAGVKG